MKKLSLGILFATMTLVSAALHAGDSAHGGGAFICADPSQNELLDLWEVEHVHKKQVLRNSEPVSVQIEEMLRRLIAYSPSFGKLVETELRQLPKIVLSPNMELMPPPDAQNIYKKPGCELQGVALYFDSASRLEIDHKKLASLPLTDQAALDFHEAVYKALRGLMPQQDSALARRIVGFVVANALKSLDHGLPAKNYHICENDWGNMAYLWNEGDDVYLQLVRFYEKGSPFYMGRLKMQLNNNIVARQLDRIGKQPLPNEAILLPFALFTNVENINLLPNGAVGSLKFEIDAQSGVIKTSVWGSVSSATMSPYFSYSPLTCGPTQQPGSAPPNSKYKIEDVQLVTNAYLRENSYLEIAVPPQYARARILSFTARVVGEKLPKYKIFGQASGCYPRSEPNSTVECLSNGTFWKNHWFSISLGGLTREMRRGGEYIWTEKFAGGNANKILIQNSQYSDVSISLSLKILAE